jgi:hypothetical protein
VRNALAGGSVQHNLGMTVVGRRPTPSQPGAASRGRAPKKRPSGCAGLACHLSGVARSDAAGIAVCRRWSSASDTTGKPTPSWAASRQGVPEKRVLGCILCHPSAGWNVSEGEPRSGGVASLDHRLPPLFPTGTTPSALLHAQRTCASLFALFAALSCAARREPASARKRPLECRFDGTQLPTELCPPHG